MSSKPVRALSLVLVLVLSITTLPMTSAYADKGDPPPVVPTLPGVLAAPDSFRGSTIWGPGYVFDDFRKLEIKEPGTIGNDPYWWVINFGDWQQYYDYQGDAGSVRALKDRRTTFARLELVHDLTPPVWDYQEYLSAEISEYQTMYAYGTPGRWLPTYGHPVIISERVRFSSNYMQDGTGGAIGTAGTWMWNSFAPNFPAYAFGWQWVEAGSANCFTGLQLLVLQDTYPVYCGPITQPVDMTDWHLWTMSWSANRAGEQTIHWWLDDTHVGSTTLAVPFEALSLFNWVDNSFPTITDDGQYVVLTHNPEGPQSYDIDWLAVFQPQ